MTKRMLIDATHAEETRVVVLDGNRLEEFDVETSTKKQLKGNIYLARVVRVEPSLQAAFVEYGGGRHGFLAFGEIHPDYYQIPVADRQRLLAMQAEEARAAEAAEDEEASRATRPEPEQRHSRDDRGRGRRRRPAEAAEPVETDAETAPEVDPAILATVEATVAETYFPETAPDAEAHIEVPAADPVTHEPEAAASEPAPPTPPAEPAAHEASAEPAPQPEAPPSPVAERPEEPGDHHGPAKAAVIPQDTKFGEETYAHAEAAEAGGDEEPDHAGYAPSDLADAPADAAERHEGADGEDAEEAHDGEEQPAPETIGGEGDTFEGNGAEEARQRRTARFLRNYRIQEVIKRRQIMLIQVVKEERGTKGAALTTYISLAGRYCVLMPNSPRGGGISRKITSASDRKRLKEITAELEVPQGMGLIVRTAGANRPKPEIKRDCEYLMRLWDDIREHTLRSVAPALIYEEANLIKRAIRDVYSRDVDEVLVDGEEGWKAAHDFMRMLMPSHAKKVQLWNDPTQGLFSRYGVDVQLDAMVSPTVQLKSGGYLVIGQTEALVAIDVNSGRSTRQRGIEETALQTNLEAADEVARQLRLRDLAGLIVIDFIDMESRKSNAMVERRLKDALKTDRARIQLGSISHFGLLEMSRQRLRPSLAETSFVTCEHCAGLGLVRSTESSAIHVLRHIEEEGLKARASLVMVHVAGAVAMYILNNKRDRLLGIEARTGMRVHFTADDTLMPPQVRIEKLRAMTPEDVASARPAVAGPVAPTPPVYDSSDEEEDVETEGAEAEEAPQRRAEGAAPLSAGEEAERRGRRRRRRRRGGREETPPVSFPEPHAGEPSQAASLADEAARWEAEPGWESLPDQEVPAEAAQEAAEGGEPGEQPAVDATELDENGMPRPRRRGRRGGRRRRRDGTLPGEEAEPGAAPEATAPPPAFVAPVYAGPTPADPFAGANFDIFDMMEQQEAEAAAPPPAPAMPAEPEPEEAEQAHAQAEESESLERLAPPLAPEPGPEPEAAPAAEPEQPEAAEPVTRAAPVEPVIGPPVKPVVIGADPLPEAPPKRGWWRR
jgi:ribonuclease E